METSVNPSIQVGALEELTLHIRSKIQGRKVFVLTDSNVQQKWLDTIITADPGWGNAEILEVEPGEDSKSLEVCAHLWSHLLECNADRNALLINIGGGVITDLGGFVASTYKRGIAFIHIPTSLLAMVDAANGGKTGINHHHTKNCIGSFQLPEEILIYQGFLETLDAVELKSGFAEMLKHGLIRDKQHWDDLVGLNEINAATIQKYIARSVAIKEEIVRNDFYEKGERKLLNVGHTVGHAIESYFMEKGNSIKHGEAVALGIICETHIARQLNLLDEEVYSQIISGITKFFDPKNYSLPQFEEIAHYLFNDKKNSEGKLQLSLPNGIGAAVYNVTVTLETVSNSYRSLLFV